VYVPCFYLKSVKSINFSKNYYTFLYMLYPVGGLGWRSS